MKNILTIVLGVMLLASCSSPKYAYYFDHYDYNSGKKKQMEQNHLAAMESVSDVPTSPLLLEKHEVVASISKEPIGITEPTEKVLSPVTTNGKKFSEMSREEKKEMKKALKVEIKNYLKTKKKAEGNADKATQVMDYNLKMAIIFGAVAVTLSFFGGVNSVFWILSVVALVVGVVFFIKWLAEQ